MSSMRTSPAPTARTRTLEAGELAWIVAPPCALLVLLAILVLGPPLAHAFMEPPPGEVLWPHSVEWTYGSPEPLKHARILIALGGALLLPAAVLAARLRPPRLGDAAIRGLVLTSQLLLVALAAFALLGQNDLILGIQGQWHIFAPAELLGAAAVPVVLIALMRRRPLAAWIVRHVPDTPRRRTACLAVAAVLTACWLLSAVNTEGSIGKAPFSDLPPWTMADPLAILDGRTPLVNFYVLYGQVWAYVAAAAMYVFGSTITVFSIVMSTASGLSLLALYATLRRVVRSALLGLALYLPVLALGFLTLSFLPIRPINSAQIFSLWPIRYGGPYLLLWLTARHLDGVVPRRAWPLFLAGGLVAVNNAEFGAGALAGTAVALVCARPPRSWQAAGRLAGEAAAGLLGALALVVLVTLVRSGELPRASYLSEYPRVYGKIGYTGLPLPPSGLHLVVYATFAAALAMAAVRLVRAEPDRLLTALFAWSGIFGLSAGSYFSGRSETVKLLALFSAWGLSLALFAILVVRALAARGWRRPRIPELLVLAALGLGVVGLHDVPAPWAQVQRLGRTTTPPLYREADAARFLAAHTHRGRHVAILIPMGQRLAREAGIVDVAPFAFIQAVVSEGQYVKTLQAARHDGAAVFFKDSEVGPEHLDVLTTEGFVQAAHAGGYSEWVLRR